jgi:hypothetical protein
MFRKDPFHLLHISQSGQIQRFKQNKETEVDFATADSYAGNTLGSAYSILFILKAITGMFI